MDNKETEEVKKILFVNASVRKSSRTELLARHLLEKLDGEIRELRLSEISFPAVDEAFLSKRDDLRHAQKYDDTMFDLANEFAQADEIVISAPYWDLSFPATLKQYLEQINVVGITFLYDKRGIPQGLCKAEHIYYVTTAGGSISNEEFGYGYVKALAEDFYGIRENALIKAEGLDIVGTDVSAIMNDALMKIDRMFE